MSNSTDTKSVVATEPVAVYQAGALLLSVALAAVGVVVDPGTVVNFALGAVAFVGYVVAAVKARSKVTPVV